MAKRNTFRLSVRLSPAQQIMRQSGFRPSAIRRTGTVAIFVNADNIGFQICHVQHHHTHRLFLENKHTFLSKIKVDAEDNLNFKIVLHNFLSNCHGCAAIRRLKNEIIFNPNLCILRFHGTTRIRTTIRSAKYVPLEWFLHVITSNLFMRATQKTVAVISP